MVVTTHPTPATVAATALPDVDERRAAMDAAWEAATRPALDLVRRRSGDGLRVTNVLGGSPSFVAVGPRGAWRELPSSPEAALCGATVEPDDPEWCAEPPLPG